MPDSIDFDPKAVRRRSQRVLSMVEELHKMGYQRLRIAPGMSPSGAYWRCYVTPIDNILVTHGARLASYEDELSARYSSADDYYFFGWEDRRTATARELASTFVERYPYFAKLGHGRDWEYAGWYVEMLGQAEQGFFPVAIEEYGRDDVIRLTTVEDTDEERTLPLPPPGNALQEFPEL